MKNYHLTLPLPPTLNHTYRFAGKIMYKTSQAKEWETEAQWLIKKEKRGAKAITGGVEIGLTLYLKYDRDIDSSFKLLFDCLQKCGMLENDKLITSLHVFKFKDKQNPRLEVTVTEIDS